MTSGFPYEDADLHMTFMDVEDLGIGVEFVVYSKDAVVCRFTIERPEEKTWDEAVLFVDPQTPDVPLRMLLPALKKAQQSLTYPEPGSSNPVDS